MSEDVLNWHCPKHGRTPCACWRAAIDAEIDKERGRGSERVSY